MDRPIVPADIKRILRRESGFGCCFCGYPFYEFHHINPWARKNQHDPEDMMVVCPNHHHACTNSAISEDEQRIAKAKPVNLEEGFIFGKLHVGQQNLLVDIGSNIIEDTPTIFSSSNNDEVFMGLAVNDLGILELSMSLIDGSGNFIGLIDRNEWIVSIPDAWDLEASERFVTLRSGPRNITVKIDARKYPITVTGNWKFGSSSIEVKPSTLIVNSNKIAGGRTKCCGSAFGI